MDLSVRVCSMAQAGHTPPAMALSTPPASRGSIGVQSPTAPARLAEAASSPVSGGITGLPWASWSGTKNEKVTAAEPVTLGKLTTKRLFGGLAAEPTVGVCT